MSTSGSPPKKIHFEVGAKLEAMDYTQNWYPAKICRVDSHGKKALIHFEGWNHRFDEWIAFNSERLRPHRGGHLEHKEEKTQQEWRNGDRILAKWQDCKFYPAKILKINTDGSFEVLFYDGFKKTVQRSNIKPDNSKKTFPVDKELAMEKSERIERRAKLAAGRAERARKRSKELAGISPSPPTSKRRERGRRTKAEEEMGMTSESSMSSPAEPPQEVPEADEVPVDTANMATDQTEREKAPETMETSQPITQNAKTPEIETSTHKETWSEKQEKEVLTGKNSSRDKTSGEIHSVKNTTKANETSANEESLPELDISNEDPKSLSKDMLNVNKQNTDTIDTNSLSGGCRGPQNDVDLEEDRKVSSREASASENIHEVEKPLSSASAQDKDHYSSVEPNTDKAKEVSRIRNIIQSVKETIANENNNIQAMVSSICKQADLRTDLAATASRQGMIKPQRKPKSTGRGGSRGAMNPRKRALRGSGRNSMSPRGYGYSMAFMDPVSKPESSESLATTSSSPTTSASITASSSPVLHQAEKEASCVNVETKETKTASGLLPDSEELNEVLEADEETVVVIPADPVNTATASSTSPATTLSKPKTQNFHKKKMRLDQITDKLSAQCKSQIEAAASSPSAFQVAKPHTPTPPPPTQQPAPQPTMQTTPTHSSTSHTPPTPISAPYPVEGYPPPLIYAPMSGACCTNPHCHGQHQAMYANPPPSHRGPLPPPHGMHGMGPSPHLHVPSSPYVMYQPGVPCSCSGCTGGVYRPTGPITHPESALARLIQCEQRILHSGPRPSIPHYREAPTPHSPWLAHGHPHQQYMSLPSKREEMWRQQEAERSALMRNTPSLSPTSESAMLQNWRQKLERPLTTLKLNQPDSSPASTPASIPESANNTPLHPSLSSKQETSVPKSDNNTVVTTQAASVTPATPSASSADATTPSSMSPQQRTSAMTPNGTPVSMVGGKMSLGSTPRTAELGLGQDVVDGEGRKGKDSERGITGASLQAGTCPDADEDWVQGFCTTPCPKHYKRRQDYNEEYSEDETYQLRHQLHSSFDHNLVCQDQPHTKSDQPLCSCDLHTDTCDLHYGTPDLHNDTPYPIYGMCDAQPDTYNRHRGICVVSIDVGVSWTDQESFAERRRLIDRERKLRPRAMETLTQRTLRREKERQRIKEQRQKFLSSSLSDGNCKLQQQLEACRIQLREAQRRRRARVRALETEEQRKMRLRDLARKAKARRWRRVSGSSPHASLHGQSSGEITHSNTESWSEGSSRKKELVKSLLGKYHAWNYAKKRIKSHPLNMPSDCAPSGSTVNSEKRVSSSGETKLSDLGSIRSDTNLHSMDLAIQSNTVDGLSAQASGENQNSYAFSCFSCEIPQNSLRSELPVNTTLTTHHPSSLHRLESPPHTYMVKGHQASSTFAYRMPVPTPEKQYPWFYNLGNNKRHYPNVLTPQDLYTSKRLDNTDPVDAVLERPFIDNEDNYKVSCQRQQRNSQMVHRQGQVPSKKLKFHEVVFSSGHHQYREDFKKKCSYATNCVTSPQGSPTSPSLLSVSTESLTSFPAPTALPASVSQTAQVIESLSHVASQVSRDWPSPTSNACLLPSPSEKEEGIQEVSLTKASVHKKFIIVSEPLSKTPGNEKETMERFKTPGNQEGILESLIKSPEHGNVFRNEEVFLEVRKTPGTQGVNVSKITENNTKVLEVPKVPDNKEGVLGEYLTKITRCKKGICVGKSLLKSSEHGQVVLVGQPILKLPINRELKTLKLPLSKCAGNEKGIVWQSLSSSGHGDGLQGSKQPLVDFNRGILVGDYKKCYLGLVDELRGMAYAGENQKMSMVKHSQNNVVSSLNCTSTNLQPLDSTKASVNLGSLPCLPSSTEQGNPASTGAEDPVAVSTFKSLNSSQYLQDTRLSQTCNPEDRTSLQSAERAGASFTQEYLHRGLQNYGNNYERHSTLSSGCLRGPLTGEPVYPFVFPRSAVPEDEELRVERRRTQMREAQRRRRARLRAGETEQARLGRLQREARLARDRRYRRCSEMPDTGTVLELRENDDKT
ncbi:uncharacterized protein LOC5508662 isoform X2 [Nematostella vectensis]|uniref:uncharacterized protein LOC5508662 isoform X2 n=1 Tax=Nematostella vectensis TaxID=45351 RepID=UPI002077460F|nr:uncharacterized protein LOC5508662 isoform X2 [Nematostella vectensis]